MTDRITVVYRITGNDPAAVAEAIRVEQTIEFPHDLAPEWIQHEVVGRVEEISGDQVTILYDPRVAGGELTQLLNVLWGNVSLFPGVRIVDLALPESITALFDGPRYGIEGLRAHFGAATRPLITTALKPMGTSSADFAETAHTLALAGFDIIKDDHSLANQPWSTWRERVTLVSKAVAEANAITGGNSAYAPSLNLPADQVLEAARSAQELGAGALLILPGITGFDSLRVIAKNIELPIMAHPSMLGSYTISPNEGIAHGILFSTLMRLAGADITIFPNFGGRFSFSKQECLEIREAAIAPLGSIAPIWISPGGGMSLERIPEMIDFYGKDTSLLIGGALHRGSLRENADRMAHLVKAY